MDHHTPADAKPPSEATDLSFIYGELGHVEAEGVGFLGESLSESLLGLQPNRWDTVAYHDIHAPLMDPSMVFVGGEGTVLPSSADTDPRHVSFAFPSISNSSQDRFDAPNYSFPSLSMPFCGNYPSFTSTLNQLAQEYVEMPLTLRYVTPFYPWNLLTSLRRSNWCSRVSPEREMAPK